MCDDYDVETAHLVMFHDQPDDDGSSVRFEIITEEYAEPQLCYETAHIAYNQVVSVHYDYDRGRIHRVADRNGVVKDLPAHWRPRSQKSEFDRRERLPRAQPLRPDVAEQRVLGLLRRQGWRVHKIRSAGTQAGGSYARDRAETTRYSLPIKTIYMLERRVRIQED